MTTSRGEASKEVVIVGAGFSHAVSRHYPLTEELGDVALDRSGIPEPDCPREGTRFEVWLSRLAEDQPWRSVSDNLHAREVFARISEALAGVLQQRELQALAEPAPGWLGDLVAVLHARRATVVSFDYDHVLEAAVDGAGLVDHTVSVGNPRVVSADILDRIPPLPPATPEEIQTPSSTVGGVGAGLAELLGTAEWPHGDPRYVKKSFRLFKLHGSLSWYWSPDDTTGITLQRWRTPGTFGHPAPDDLDERSRSLPGRVPFVVPPTATKSSYLTNLVIRELWDRARKALAEADRVIVLGYSVPAEDQVAGGLLAETAAGRDVEVFVADRSADPVAARLVALGVPEVPEGHRFGGVQALVEWWRDQQAGDIVRRLRVLAAKRLPRLGSSPWPTRLFATWGDQHFNRGAGPYAGAVDLEAIRVSEDGTDLIVPRVTPPSSVSAQDDATVFLRCLAEAPRVERIVVTADDGRFPVVDVWVPEPPEAKRLGQALTLVATPTPLS